MLFASTLTSYPALGDGPEMVAGAASLGILHAPGYPTYVIAAHLFGLLPLGGAAFKVNLFSALCAAAFVGGLQLLARRCGVPRWAAAFAALCVGTGAGFWFYADFAKHDTFSGLMALIVIYLLVDLDLRAAAEPGTRAPARRPPSALKPLLGLGSAFGLGLGASWPLMVLVAPTALFVLVRRARAVGVRGLLAAVASCLVVTCGAYGFVMIRAAQHPRVDWGNATSISNVIDLVDRGDLSSTPPPIGSTARRSAAESPRRAPAGSPSSASGASPGASDPSLLTYIGSNFSVFDLELGLVALLLAGWGALVSILTRRRTTLLLTITFVVGVLVTAYRLAVPFVSSYDTDLEIEGFMLSCYVALACWIAIGIGDLHDRGRRGVARLRGRAFRAADAVAAAVVAAVLIAAIVSNRSIHERADRPLADEYATTVFSELPRHAVVMIGDAEFAQPLIYRQVVDHQRLDVTVLLDDGISTIWYRNELARQIRHPLPLRTGNVVTDGRAVARALLARRPVYADLHVAQELEAASAPGAPVGYLPVGLLARLLSTPGVARVANPAVLAGTVRRVESAAGMPSRIWNEWPNHPIARTIYVQAPIEVARAYFEHQNIVQTSDWLQNALAVDPTCTLSGPENLHITCPRDY